MTTIAIGLFNVRKEIHILGKSDSFKYLYWAEHKDLIDRNPDCSVYPFEGLLRDRYISPPKSAAVSGFIYGALVDSSHIVCDVTGFNKRVKRDCILLNEVRAVLADKKLLSKTSFVHYGFAIDVLDAKFLLGLHNSAAE